MKKVVPLLIFVFINLAVECQKFHVGIQIGTSISKLSNNLIDYRGIFGVEKYSYSPSIDGFCGIDITKRIGLEFSPGFLHRGGKVFFEKDYFELSTIQFHLPIGLSYSLLQRLKIVAGLDWAKPIKYTGDGSFHEITFKNHLSEFDRSLYVGANYNFNKKLALCFKLYGTKVFHNYFYGQEPRVSDGFYLYPKWSLLQLSLRLFI